MSGGGARARLNPGRMASEENKFLAAYLQSKLSPACTVVRFEDGKNKSSIDILTAANAQPNDVAAHVTVNFSDQPIDLMLGDAPLRVELLIAAYGRFKEAPNIVSTCAFNRINAGYAIAPDIVHPDAVSHYLPKSAMRHVMLVAPFSWELETQRLASKTVAWLQLLPLSDAELKFAENNGPDELQDLLEASRIDAFDLNRRSVL